MLVVLGAAGYYWYTHRTDFSITRAPPVGTWMPVSIDVSAKGQTTVASLWTSGKRTVTLTPAEAAGYMVVGMAGFFPQEAEAMAATISGDTLYVRSRIALSDIGGAKVLGPMAGMLSASDTVYLAVTIDILRPGLGQLRVVGVRVRDLEIPRALVPKIIAQIRRQAPADSALGVRPGELASNGIPIPIPPYIGDVRVGKGKVTLFKSVQ